MIGFRVCDVKAVGRGWVSLGAGQSGARRAESCISRGEMRGVF